VTRNIVIDYDNYQEFLDRILADGHSWPAWRKSLFGGSNMAREQTMTTDQMILALVQRHGFKLPEGLFYEVADGLSWFLQNHNGRKIWHLESGQHVFAHDLCAMEFARQYHNMCDGLTLERPYCPACENELSFKKAMGLGDSAAAIKALYDAMESR